MVLHSDFSDNGDEGNSSIENQLIVLKKVVRVSHRIIVMFC
jgi:hypothetical protein